MAHFQNLITTIDSHTAGESTRLVTSGLPPILGDTLAEKLVYAENHLSWAPRLLLLEPRGHKDLYGAVLVPPCDPTAQIGVIFMNNHGFEPMCGHGLIGVVTSLFETGILEMSSRETEVKVDTPVGVVRAHAQIVNGSVREVSFDNIPAFIYQKDVNLNIPHIGRLVVDIAFGGNFFVLVNAAQIGLSLEQPQAAHLADLGMHILQIANGAIPVRHPIFPEIDRIIDLRFYWEITGGDVNSRNVVILGDHMVDRSPCGTGTCAELAARYERGQIQIGEPFVTESIIGTRFTGYVMEETQVINGDKTYPAIIPRISGSAYLTGLHQFILQPDDPFPIGFCLSA